MTDEEETMEVSDGYATLGRIDERDRKVKESVVAYLMYQSGWVLSKKKYPDYKARSARINELGTAAIHRASVRETIQVDPRRVLASQSIRTQVQESDPLDSKQIVCYLDGELFGKREEYLPVFDIDGDFTNLKPPEDLELSGFSFKSYEDFRKKFADFGLYIITDPKTVTLYLDQFHRDFVINAYPDYEELTEIHDILPNWRVVGAPKACDLKFSRIPVSSDIGKIVRVRGQVSEVGDSLIVMRNIAFRCNSYLDEAKTRKCNTINLVPQNIEEGVITKPSECSRCSGKDFVMEDSSKSQHENMQRIQLQEVDLSENPKDLMVELRSELVDKLRAGSTIEVTGVLRSTPLNKGSLMGTKYILAHSYSVVDEEALKTVVSEEEQMEVEALCDSMDFRERLDYLIWSWSGHLLCEPLLKRALFLQAVGSPEESTFGHRSGIHILIAGDPGTVKTHLLRAMRNLVLGSRMVSAEAATKAGLVAGCQQVEDLYTNKKRWALTPGALALTPKEAICCVDELNLYNGDFGDFNNALETGEVYITKVVSGKVDTRCSVLAAANPKAGDRKKFVKGVSFLQQLGLDTTVIQRFDAIFILLDEANYEQDKAIGKSVLGRNTSKDIKPMEMDFIRKYIAHAKTVDPVLSDEAVEYIATQHAEKRQASKGSDYIRSHRQVPALRRLTLAAARFDLKEVATVEHVKHAEEILAITLNEQDPGQVEGDTPAADRDFRKSIAKLFVAYTKDKGVYENIDYRFVLEYAKDKGSDLDANEVQSILKSFAKNKETGVRQHKDGTFSYNGPQNPAYEVW